MLCLSFFLLLSHTCLAERASWTWVGGVTESSMSFRVVGYAGSDFWFQDTAGTLPQDIIPIVSDAEPLLFSNLTANTAYSYGIVGESASIGEIKTFPAEGQAADFRVTFASCSYFTDTDTYDYALQADPSLHIVMGDFFYANIDEDSDDQFNEWYDKVLHARAPKNFYQQTPVAYVWDDHDFGPDDSDSNSPSKPAAARSYRRNVPHYPLVSPGGAVYQSFTMGRVRFILLDARSESVSGEEVLLTDAQWTWFEDELSNASNYGLVVIVSSMIWIGEDNPGKDSWPGHINDRRRVADYIATNNIDNIVMLMGEAHMLAIDDGSNSDYSDLGPAGFPIFVAAPFHHTGKAKGGPYSEGCHGYRVFPNQHFGLMQVRDNGTNLCIEWSAMDVQGSEVVPVMTYQQCGPFVREGNPGVGSCSLAIFPAWVWFCSVVGVIGWFLIWILFHMMRTSPNCPWGTQVTWFIGLLHFFLGFMSLGLGFLETPPILFWLGVFSATLCNTFIVCLMCGLWWFRDCYSPASKDRRVSQMRKSSLPGEEDDDNDINEPLSPLPNQPSSHAEQGDAEDTTQAEKGQEEELVSKSSIGLAQDDDGAEGELDPLDLR